MNARAAMIRTAFALAALLWANAANCQTPNEIDVLLIIGQSNANPNSEAKASVSPIPKGAVFKFQDGALSDGDDPVGMGLGGSAWPSFGETYHRLTARKICFVPAAMGSSAMVAAADPGTGHWSTTGTLYTAALAAHRAAIAALIAAGYSIGRQFIIDVQGETDGYAIDSGKTTAAEFQAAKQSMIASARADLGIPELPFYFSLLGAPGIVQDPGWAAIQAAQKAICAADPHTGIPFWNADSFPRRGMQQKSAANAVHYTQAGYDEMGRELAEHIVDGTSLPCRSVEAGR